MSHPARVSAVVVALLAVVGASVQVPAAKAAGAPIDLQSGSLCRLNLPSKCNRSIGHNERADAKTEEAPGGRRVFNDRRRRLPRLGAAL